MVKKQQIVSFQNELEPRKFEDRGSESDAESSYSTRVGPENPMFDSPYMTPVINERRSVSNPKPRKGT